MKAKSAAAAALHFTCKQVGMDKENKLLVPLLSEIY